jgi:hypothetical protein
MLSWHVIEGPLVFFLIVISPRRRLKDNIETDLQELGCGGMDWIELAQDRNRWWALVNAAKKPRVT